MIIHREKTYLILSTFLFWGFLILCSLSCITFPRILNNKKKNVWVPIKRIFIFLLCSLNSLLQSPIMVLFIFCVRQPCQYFKLTFCFSSVSIFSAGSSTASFFSVRVAEAMVKRPCKLTLTFTLTCNFQWNVKSSAKNSNFWIPTFFLLIPKLIKKEKKINLSQNTIQDTEISFSYNS